MSTLSPVTAEETLSVAPLGASAAPEGARIALADDEAFLRELPEISEFNQLFDTQRYAPVPRSALIVLTDVRGSTSAIEAGRYRDVNALGVASIIAVCNAMRDLELPYVFGGDGATLIIPRGRRLAAERALRGVRKMAQSAFDLELRTSIVPVADLMANGHVARVARYRPSPHTWLAAFSGTAFSQAERWAKEGASGQRYEVNAEGESEASFEGFECRWQPLGSRRGNTVSLLVMALSSDEAARAQTYRDVLRAFDRIVDAPQCSPVSTARLTFSGFWGDYSVEARIRAQGKAGPGYDAALRGARQQTLIGRLLGTFGLSAGGFNGARYKSELVANSDFRKFDETLRMVVDLNRAEQYRLESRLAAEHRAGRLAYGMHKSPAALITCLVRSYQGDHVHFVDGSDGGYALAAKQLKEQLAAKASESGG